MRRNGLACTFLSLLALCACEGSEPPEEDFDRTGVYVNGRELTPSELDGFRQILPGLSAGRWRMAQNGDFGRESERPVINLVLYMRARVAAQLRAQMQGRATQAQAVELMRRRALAVQGLYASQGWGWNDGGGYVNGNWAQGGYSGALSTYDRTGTGVYGDASGLVGVMTEGGSWYPGP